MPLALPNKKAVSNTETALYYPKIWVKADTTIKLFIQIFW